jgi:cytoskeletal protein RodZ
MIPSRIWRAGGGSTFVPNVYVQHLLTEYARLLGFRKMKIADCYGVLKGYKVSYTHTEEPAPYTSVKRSMLPVILSGIFKVAFLCIVACGLYAAYIHFFAARESENIPLVSSSSQSSQSMPSWSGSEPVAPEGASLAKTPDTPSSRR